jgi:hypothetical protein
MTEVEARSGIVYGDLRLDTDQMLVKASLAAKIGEIDVLTIPLHCGPN